MVHLLIAAAFAASSLSGPRLVSVASAKPSPAAAPSRNAPADEYYGRLHMSALRLRQRIDQLAGRYHARTESDDDIVHDAGDIQDAMRIWISRYPHDVWAAPTAYHLAQLYMLVQSASARTAARGAFQYVAGTFPGTSFAHNATLRLAQGFPELRAESPVVASPAPDATASAAAAPAAAMSASPSAAASAATAAATPGPPPVPAPSPSPSNR